VASASCQPEPALIGAAIGSVLGIFGAYLFTLVIRNSLAPGQHAKLPANPGNAADGLLGLVVGANKGDLLNLAALGGVFGGERQGKKSYKILDTASLSTAGLRTMPRPASSTALS